MPTDVIFTGWDKIKLRLLPPHYGPKTYGEHQLEEQLNREVLGERYRPGMTDAEIAAALVCRGDE